MRNKTTFFVFCPGLLIFMFLGMPCEAHKVKMFATAEGDMINGYVYYTTGGKPKNAIVRIENPAGESVGEVVTDEEGQFTFRATQKQDYTFILELADGHRATFTVSADELPDSLPGIAEQPASFSPAPETLILEGMQPKTSAPTPLICNTAGVKDPTEHPQSAEDSQSFSPPLVGGDSGGREDLFPSQGCTLEDIEQVVDKAVAKHIRPLREQIDHYEGKIRFHDILGGIGYIVGAMGLWFFLGGRKRNT